MIRLVLFDIDGTLIRTGGAGVRAFEKTFATAFGIPQATQGLKFCGRTDTSLVRECFERHGIPATLSEFERFFDTYVFWLSHLLGELQGEACPGVREFLRRLEALPEPPLMGLLTGNIRLGAEIKLRHYGLWEFFRMGAFGDDHESRNELARIARKRGSNLLGTPLKGEEVLVIGDTPLDIECGGAIGARVLAVATGNFSCDTLRQHRATWILESLSEASPAEFCS